MLSQELRRKFLQYFNDRGHTVVPSSSVVPHDDPTLLFTNAGMNQFKDVFLGQNKRDYSKAASAQKCIRVGGKHNDLDNVGHTSRHLTFFEMLGNFSFGDYFKKEAIAYAWECTTQVLEFDPSFLWITVFEEDDEAFELWQKHVPIERIIRMDAAENFWAMGDTGPCGPSSELYYDRGEKYGSGISPKDDPSGNRYMEFWNLVFMQYNRDQNGRMTPLPNQSIDTGAGIERIASLKMGVDNVFHTDVLRHIIGQIENVSGKKYEAEDTKTAPAFHVIADHLRALSFAISDGVQPSNIERGYVLRKILRRAVRYGRTLLGLEEPFFANILPSLIDIMGPDYKELVTNKDQIAEILTLEEEGFIRTLRRGGNILSTIVEKALKSPHKQISGEDAFKLKDTYGFPLEEILLIAKDSNLQVNIDAYQLLEEKAKELSRSSRIVEGQLAKESLYADFAKKQGLSTFIGYSDLKADSEIIGIIQNGEFVESLNEGSKGLLLLQKTPFYAEKGGQVGDTGFITGENSRFHVTDCQSPFPGIITHIGCLEHGSINLGNKITASIDIKRRRRIEAHHTATHLLHYALQQVVGDHIKQAGSLVEPDRLRFDFNHHKPLSPEDIREVEDLINEKIRENTSITTYDIPFAEAQNRPEIKQFFGEKYGAHVRVVDIDYSKELCGGCHAYHVGMLGYFRITKESSIASGVRRIEAATGHAAENFVRSEEALLQEAASLLKASVPKINEKLSSLIEENAELNTQLRTLKRSQLKQLSAELVQQIENNILASLVSVEPEDLSELADLVFQKMGTGVLALAIKLEERVQIVIKVSPEYVKKGISAGALVKEIAPLIGGGGGGRPEAAQAGGKNPAGIDAALSKIKTTSLS